MIQRLRKERPRRSRRTNKCHAPPHCLASTPRAPPASGGARACDPRTGVGATREHEQLRRPGRTTVAGSQVRAGSHTVHALLHDDPTGRAPPSIRMRSRKSHQRSMLCRYGTVVRRLIEPEVGPAAHVLECLVLELSAQLFARSHALVPRAPRRTSRAASPRPNSGGTQGPYGRGTKNRGPAL